MALILAVRNASRIQAAATILPQHFLKCTPAAFTVRGISTTSSQKKQFLSPTKLISQTRQLFQDHSKVWTIDRGLTSALVFLIPATIAFPNCVFDNLTAFAFVVHFHLGLESCIVDYAKPHIVGKITPKILTFLLCVISGLTFGSLISYNVSNIGIGKTIRKFWAIKN